MITLESDTLVFRFPEVHEDAITEIEFQRTLRIPDDTKEYPLPPGLGAFQLRHTEDFKGRLPKEWTERGGVLMPMHRAEAMWLSFRSRVWRSKGYPCAIKIAAGKINAVSGKRWQPELTGGGDQDYVVVPGQPWLDGYCVAKGQIRQFVAMQLGEGYTAEEQITGKAEHGGLQIIVYPMKAERWEALEAERRRREAEEARQRARGLEQRAYSRSMKMAAVACAVPAAMGLAAGGRMRQEIYKDPHGLEAWEQGVSSRCFVTMLDARQWQELTGTPPAMPPPTAEDYAKSGLPWFDYYDEAAGEALGGAPPLSMLKGTTEVAEEKGDDVLDKGAKVDAGPIVKLGPKRRRPSPAAAKGTDT